LPSPTAGPSAPGGRPPGPNVPAAKLHSTTISRHLPMILTLPVRADVGWRCHTPLIGPVPGDPRELPRATDELPGPHEGHLCTGRRNLALEAPTVTIPIRINVEKVPPLHPTAVNQISRTPVGNRGPVPVRVGGGLRPTYLDHPKLMVRTIWYGGCGLPRGFAGE